MLEIFYLFGFQFQSKLSTRRSQANLAVNGAKKLKRRTRNGSDIVFEFVRPFPPLKIFLGNYRQQQLFYRKMGLQSLPQAIFGVVTLSHKTIKSTLFIKYKISFINETLNSDEILKSLFLIKMDKNRQKWENRQKLVKFDKKKVGIEQ